MYGWNPQLKPNCSLPVFVAVIVKLSFMETDTLISSLKSCGHTVRVASSDLRTSVTSVISSEYSLAATSNGIVRAKPCCGSSFEKRLPNCGKHTGILLRETVAELRKADGDTAVERLAPVVVALRRAEDHLRMARRAIGKDVCAEKRDFRRAILVCEDDVRVSAVPRAEHDAARRAIAGIELVDVHRFWFMF